MKRKVIKQGHNTLTITLPTQWAEKQEIKAGDEIEVEEKENQLVLTKETNLTPKEIDIDVTDLDRTSIVFYIRSLYRSGYNLRAIRFDNQKTLFHRYKKEEPVYSVINEEIKRLMGVEILERKTNSCLVRCMTEENPEDFDNFLRRIFLLTSMMFEHLIHSFEDKDITGLELIKEDHDNITKFISYCYRVLNKKGLKTNNKVTVYYSLLELIEFIVDIIEDISIEGIDYKDKISKNLNEILKRIKFIFDDFKELFYKYNLNNVVKLGNSRDLIFEKIKNSIKKFNKEETSIISKMQIIPIVIIRYLVGIRFSMEH